MMQLKRNPISKRFVYDFFWRNQVGNAFTTSIFEPMSFIELRDKCHFFFSFAQLAYENPLERENLPV